ncbi:hypothetical protein E5676_scaffold258G00130 [Cucumis melo var. makuwa]|uniref:Mucin-19-like n=1 Tax=Cucumis melo var. makuwa TaxID=1194695 RepID=A0A5D3DY00_CUCMM|nr:hypothetical protein E5676_scaffold258G00130 [Cucumis melo var. makuwa]
MALRYECLRSSMYRLTTPILYAISGLVHVRYRILLQTSVSTCIYLISSLKSREFCAKLHWYCYSKTGSHLSFLEGNRGLTLKFTVARQVDPLRVDSIGGHNQVSGKGFPTTGPRIDAGNVVIHKGLHVTRPLVVACVPSGVRSCLRIDTDAGCSVRGSLLSGLWSWSLVVEGRSTRLICASFGSTRLIRASLGISRLIGVSFGITRLIRASFGITRLICAFYGTTRLLCRVRVQRGVDRRGARRMREGHMDASGSLCFR